MNIQFVFKVEAETVTASVFTARMQRMARMLSEFHADYAAWYLTPDGPKDIWVPLDDAEAITEKTKNKFPKSGFIVGAITNRQNEAGWYKPGRATLAYSPSEGDIRFKISEADVFFGENFFQAMKGVLRLFAMDEWIEWASLDCSIKIPDERPGSKQGKMRTLDLSLDYRTFPHREFLGWMGWIQQLPPKKLLQASDLPTAAEVHSLPGRSGTIVVSVGEAFDITNPAHIEKMQRVEVRLVELELLPVIDPELM